MTRMTVTLPMICWRSRVALLAIALVLLWDWLR